MILTLIAALAFVVSQQPEATSQLPPGPEAAAWIKTNAIAFTTPVAGTGFDDLAGLDAIVGDARVVSLGEPTHGTREAFQIKHRLFEYLVQQKGFSIFSIEANMTESFALNEYVIDGKGDPRALVKATAWGDEEVLEMVEWMREWNRLNPPSTGKPRVRFTGFDMREPEAAWKIARRAMKEAAPDLLQKYVGLAVQVQEVNSTFVWGSNPRGGGTARASFPVAAARGKKLRFSCWIRTEKVTTRTDAFVRCDEAGRSIANSKGGEVRGTTPWTRHEFTIEVPADAQEVDFGLMLLGDGAAWFDDIEFEIDGVPYDDPDLFSLGFENDEVNFLRFSSNEYAMRWSTVQPHSGSKSLEIRRRPEFEVPKVDTQAMLERARAAADDLAARREDLVKKLGAWEADWAIQNARIVAQCASLYARENGFNARDESMAANVQWLLKQFPGERVVLWAHNGHVNKVGPERGIEPMGKLLAAALGDQMVVFGFATGTGQYTALNTRREAFKSNNELLAPKEGSLEAVFMDSGLANAILDIRKARADDPATGWLTRPLPMRSIGNTAMELQQFFPCTPTASYDVLVWQSRTTAARVLR